MKRTLLIVAIILGIIVGIMTFSPAIRDYINSLGDRIDAVDDTDSVDAVDDADDDDVVNEIDLNLTFDEYMKEGERLSAGGFLTLAANNFAAAAKKQPDNKNAQIRLVDMYIRLRDFDAAENTCEIALKTFANDKELSLLLGEVLLQKSDFEGAKKIFSAMGDDVFEKQFYLGAIAAFEGDYETSKQLLNLAKTSEKMKQRSDILLGAFQEYSLYPDSSPLHLDLLVSKSLNQLGLYEMSVIKSKEILKTNEKYRDAWIVLGSSYLSLGKFEFAKQGFENAIDIDPTNPESAYFLGITEAELGNYNYSISMIERAILNGFKPKVDAITKLADIYLLSENYTTAAKKYEEALQISDTNVGSFVKPVWILIDYLHDAENALKIAQWSVQKHPSSAVSNNLLGWAQLENGDFSEAEKSLNKAISLDPNYSAAYLNFGKLYEKSGDIENAISSYKKTYEMDPTSSVGILAAQKYNSLIKN